MYIDNDVVRPICTGFTPVRVKLIKLLTLVDIFVKVAFVEVAVQFGEHPEIRPWNIEGKLTTTAELLLRGWPNTNPIL